MGEKAVEHLQANKGSCSIFLRRKNYMLPCSEFKLKQNFTPLKIGDCSEALSFPDCNNHPLYTQMPPSSITF